MPIHTATSLPELMEQASAVYVIDRGNFTNSPIGERDRIASTAAEHRVMLEELIELMRDRYHLVGMGHRDFARIAVIVDDLSGFLDDTTPEHLLPRPCRRKTPLLGKVLNLIGAGRRQPAAPSRRWPLLSSEQAHLDSISRLGRAVNIQLIFALKNRPDASQISGQQRDALVGGFHRVIGKDSDGRFHVLPDWPRVE
ncbi:hypothetical protein P5V35_23950 [Mycobacteroides abscessus subsp. massiliense]|uniref:hypothetical protein n=1 Tax=Mycobacteroides abscessus TaxID=36809 RepID=UPI0009A7CE0B|nr:hypothetical protein [Mycobacteroides abscessus]MDO3208867.1 hypothetical protein [Mycobacteroides abscessus subsp. massiliense]SKT92729.1 Uncharacterised protein [Mycobacteroides abscessus subsp. massiliense]SKU12327.1 Uncharacterised protein [Mycobacteroides abscessus subsp. massiliense]